MIELYGTIGPSCQTAEQMAELLAAGLTGFRLNLSHTTLAASAAQAEALREAERISGKKAELMIDLRGGELRTGTMAPVAVQEGEIVSLGDGGIVLDGDALSVLVPEQEILIDDGVVSLTYLGSGKCRCLRGGTVASHKSVSLTGIELDRPAVAPEDHGDLAMASQVGVTAIMHPFVRRRSDLEQVRAAMHRYGLDDVRLFAKVEDREGLRNLPDWLPLCDVVTVARGDLGTALPPAELPRAQKEIARICRETGKPFLVVTHLLQSMVKSPTPTRAEVLDIYNAVLDGASALMLTGETAQGAYPLQAVQTLRAVAQAAEEDRT